MSELLRFRDWLGMPDVVRYVESLGLLAGENDIFNCYIELGYPLKLGFMVNNTYLYITKDELKSYPSFLSKVTSFYVCDWSGEGFVKCNERLSLADSMHQNGFGKDSVVFARLEKDFYVDGLEFCDGAALFAPVYWSGQLESERGFSHSLRLVTWGELLDPINSGDLLFSRSSLEEIVGRIKGKGDKSSSDSAASEKPLSTKERQTMLVLIGALCKQAGIDYKQKGIADAIQKMTENIGASLSDDTIRNVLKQIDDAVESRSR